MRYTDFMLLYRLMPREKRKEIVVPRTLNQSALTWNSIYQALTSQAQFAQHFDRAVRAYKNVVVPEEYRAEIRKLRKHI